MESSSKGSIFSNKKHLTLLLVLCSSMLITALSDGSTSKFTKFTWHKDSSHDRNCYTQGLSFINETHLLESCGLYGQSYFHILEYTENNGQIGTTTETYKSSKPYDSSVFFEGSILFPANKMIYILTWRQHIVFRINSQTMQQIDTLTWQYQGWGMTHNNSNIFISDGSDNIYLTDEQLNIVETKSITDQNNRPVRNINELEWVQDSNGDQFIFGNVYLTKKIVKIDFESGKVIEEFDCTNIAKLEKHATDNDRVLNGIAHSQSTNQFLITGKKWDNFYQANFD